MAVYEQAVVLTALAESAARPGCRFLEVGSWCGDSAVVIGKVAKRHGGRLFCIDWWKGNVGTDLAIIAGTSDVFSVFWQRMREEDLEDTVIPIRGKSEDVAGILANGSFDLVYLDGDHRFDAISDDVAKFSPLVATPGILCGDDCEGRISDFDLEFLQAGKTVDFHEAVHCGVVLAVGQAFADYSIDYNVWSVRKGAGGWAPADPALGSVPKKRQFPPPLIETVGVYNIVRYGRTVYGLPHALGSIDITHDETRKNPRLLSADSIPALKKLIHDAEKGAGGGSGGPSQPRLVGSLAGFNIVKFRTTLYAINRGLGPVDISREPEIRLDGILRSSSMVGLLYSILRFKIARMLERVTN